MPKFFYNIYGENQREISREIIRRSETYPTCAAFVSRSVAILCFSDIIYEYAMRRIKVCSRDKVGSASVSNGRRGQPHVRTFRTRESKDFVRRATVKSRKVQELLREKERSKERHGATLLLG